MREELRKRAREIVRILRDFYGPVEWGGRADPIDSLIITILSQNTSGSNTRRSFELLKKAFPKSEDLLAASEEEIARAIRVGGLPRVKARRIKEALSGILRERGDLDLSFLSSLPPSQACAWLEKFSGVGPKTARCVLLFSLSRPVLPVDTHVFRISKRLGFLAPDIPFSKASEALEEIVPEEDMGDFHVLLVRHGREICKARNPRCGECPLRPLCPSAEMILR